MCTLDTRSRAKPTFENEWLLDIIPSTPIPNVPFWKQHKRLQLIASRLRIQPIIKYICNSRIHFWYRPWRPASLQSMKRSSAATSSKTSPENPTIRCKRTLSDARRKNTDHKSTKIASASTTLANAGFYILSGCMQPIILMTVCKDSGLGHPVAQVYMLFWSLLMLLQRCNY
jgi:hypothetical protein